MRRTDSGVPSLRWRAATRAVDLAVCLTAGLVLALPLCLVLAAAVRLSSPGPALHRCTRTGRDGRPFTLLKLRTMRTGVAGPGITVAGDPRVTPLGAWLRRTKLDELPQLLNVVVGDMALVGPRPEDPAYVGASSDQLTALLVRPGMTSPASLAYIDEEAELARGDDPLHRYVDVVQPVKLALDAAFVRRQSVAEYLVVLVRTALTCTPWRDRSRRTTPAQLSHATSETGSHR